MSGTTKIHRPIYAAFHADLHDSLISSGDRVRAFEAFRREYLIEPGYDTARGAQATYNLYTDFGGHLQNAANSLTDPCAIFGTRRDRFHAAQRSLEKGLGYRWSRGVGALLECLDGCGADTKTLTAYRAERNAFSVRMNVLLDAANATARERAWDAALLNLRASLPVALEECERLAQWLEIAGLPHDARDLVQHVDNARNTLAQYDAEIAGQTVRKGHRRGKSRNRYA